MRLQPADPAATASTTAVMMGTGAVFTPTGSGKTFAHISGAVLTNTAAVNLTIGARFGTGAPPANGAAVTGAKIGADLTVRGPATAVPCAFCICDLLGLTPGQTYWLDLCLLTSAGADTAQAQNVSAVAFELS